MRRERIPKARELEKLEVILFDFYSQYFLSEKRFINELCSVSFPVSRPNVGRSSTGFETDRQCDIWVHVSALLWQNALCGGETSKNCHWKRLYLRSLCKTKRLGGRERERGWGGGGGNRRRILVLI